MHKIELTIKDESKVNLVLDWLKQFEFVEVQRPKKKDRDYDFFASAGLWKGRDITAEELRKKAWGRDKL